MPMGWFQDSKPALVPERHFDELIALTDQNDMVIYNVTLNQTQEIRALGHLTVHS